MFIFVYAVIINYFSDPLKCNVCHAYHVNMFCILKTRVQSYHAIEMTFVFFQIWCQVSFVGSLNGFCHHVITPIKYCSTCKLSKQYATRKAAEDSNEYCKTHNIWCTLFSPTREELLFGPVFKLQYSLFVNWVKLRQWRIKPVIKPVLQNILKLDAMSPLWLLSWEVNNKIGCRWYKWIYP